MKPHLKLCYTPGKNAAWSVQWLSSPSPWYARETGRYYSSDMALDAAERLWWP